MTLSAEEPKRLRKLKAGEEAAKQRHRQEKNGKRARELLALSKEAEGLLEAVEGEAAMKDFSQQNKKQLSAFFHVRVLSTTKPSPGMKWQGTKNILSGIGKGKLADAMAGEGNFISRAWAVKDKPIILKDTSMDTNVVAAGPSDSIDDYAILTFPEPSGKDLCEAEGWAEAAASELAGAELGKPAPGLMGRADALAKQYHVRIAPHLMQIGRAHV